MVMKEIWKPIKDYEGLYEISNFGNVKILARNYTRYNYLTKRYNIIKVKEKITQGTINGGYRRICLTKNKVEKNKHIHKLVAEAFIPNPNNYSYVNHIDVNKQNNYIDNLEWCTLYQNNTHAYKTGLRKSTDITPILQYDLEGNFIREYKSINEASKETNLDIRHISRNINGIGKQIGGYKFVKKEPVSTRSPIAS